MMVIVDCGQDNSKSIKNMLLRTGLESNMSRERDTLQALPKISSFVCDREGSRVRRYSGTPISSTRGIRTDSLQLRLAGLTARCCQPCA
jgi:hypothetical protein